MNPRWWRPNYCPIGIDLSSQSVKLIQLERAGDSLRVLASAVEPLPSGISPHSPEYHGHAATAIKAALGKGSFQGRRCVTSMPAQVMQYKNLRLPPMPDAELAGAVKWEANDRFHSADGLPAVQFFDAGEVMQGTERRREVILVAAPERFVEQHAKTIEALGLRLDAIDAAPAALARCVHQTRPPVVGSMGHADEPATPPEDAAQATLPGQDPHALRVILEVGYSTSHVLFARGEQVVFFKSLPVGAHALDRAAANKLGIALERAAALRQDQPEPGVPDIEHRRAVTRYNEANSALVHDLGREIGLCLRYYSVTFRGARPAQLDLIGGAADHTLAERLKPLAGTDVVVTDPLGRTDVTPVRTQLPRCSHAAWGLAAGLSLRLPDHEPALKGAA